MVRGTDPGSGTGCEGRVGTSHSIVTMAASVASPGPKVLTARSCTLYRCPGTRSSIVLASTPPLSSAATVTHSSSWSPTAAPSSAIGITTAWCSDTGWWGCSFGTHRSVTLVDVASPHSNPMGARGGLTMVLWVHSGVHCPSPPVLHARTLSAYRVSTSRSPIVNDRSPPSIDSTRTCAVLHSPPTSLGGDASPEGACAPLSRAASSASVNVRHETSYAVASFTPTSAPPSAQARRREVGWISSTHRLAGMGGGRGSVSASTAPDCSLGPPSLLACTWNSYRVCGCRSRAW
mmetsp:Transcript_24750/g.57367  ORF Transcript_24750/g.57367 Transcript_24750/m.57367 type:complete len:291 (-) Transcript_24750:1056-1928(-)